MAQKKSAAQTSKKTTAKKTTAAKTAPARAVPAGGRRPIRREVGGGVCLLLGMLAFLGLFPFAQDAWIIKGLCLYGFQGLLGWGFYVTAPCLLWLAWILIFHKGRPVKARIICVSLIPVFFGAIVHLIVNSDRFVFAADNIRSLYLGGQNYETGGVIGGVLAQLLNSAISNIGALVVLIVALVTMVFIGAKVSFRQTVENIKNHQYPPYEPEPEPEPEPAPLPARNVRTVPRAEAFDIDIPIDEKSGKTDKSKKKTGGSAKSKISRWIDIPIDDVNESPVKPPAPEPKKDDIPDMPQGIIYRGRGKNVRPVEEKKPEPDYTAVEIPSVGDTFPFLGQPESGGGVKLDNGTAEIPEGKSAGEKVSGKEAASAAEEISLAIETAGELPEYRFPSVELLRSGDGITSDGSQEIALNRERLETTLRSFGIGASISSITRGPTVTRYDLELEAGVKLNKLTNLAGDLALSLGVVNVRIAPIPDKISTVGVEVPNKIVSTVYLRDILDSPAFKNSTSKLSFAVGKDIGGNCIVGNISKMPHMLIAGTTGSGKSVCMNSLILSLLYKATPEEVRLIMIDPKMVELGIYNGIPHLYIPVVTDPKKAAGSLQWAVVEMMKRYRLFSEIGVRDLTGYNNYMSKNAQPTLPNVVIVIDELADLMMTAAKEVEESICRVAQMGRAAGMHLVIATQRPSADVITGLMKANIPSRIAFAVSSALESRIILDNQGAEKLIGMGDMLYAPLGCGKPMRVQGAFVTDEERENVINFIKEEASADYDDEIMRHIENAVAEKDKSAQEDTAPESEGAMFADYDELLPQAVDVILDTKQASVSMLQRRLKLGYSRAARLVDQMEELGIVGPFEGSKPRQILITREQWQEMSMTGNSAVEQLINEQKDDFSSGAANDRFGE